MYVNDLSTLICLALWNTVLEDGMQL